MKIQSNRLTGAALDWAVAKCEGVIWAALDGELLGSARGMNYSTDWAQGGPIIERQGMWLRHFTADDPANARWEAINGWFPANVICAGPTPLIAAMRCYVASKLGNEVEVPDGLLT